MIDAVANAVAQLFTAPLRRVLLKSVGLAILLITIIGIAMQRLLASLAESGATWAETTAGVAPHSAWATLAWILSIMAALGIVTGALFLMPAVSAFVGSFFVDEVAEQVEQKFYPNDPPGRPLPVFRGIIEGLKIALLAVLVYLVALPFLLFFGFGLLILFFGNAYLLGREYFELAAMRFLPPEEAKALRKANAIYIFLAGMIIAAFVSFPIVNLATPVFAMSYMMHIYKKMTGSKAIESIR